MKHAMLTSDRRGHVEIKSNVVPLRKPVEVNPRHPSMYDRDREPAEATVTITVLQASLIASLLQALRAHGPSPRAVDDAIDILTPGRRR